MTPEAFFSIGFAAGLGFAIGLAAFSTLVLMIASEGWPVTPGRLIPGWRRRP